MLSTSTGPAYITGPYKGAPFGLSIVVPAAAGPFGLGRVVVRAAIDVDRQSAQLHVASDPLPTSLRGVPLDVREVRVAVDKPRRSAFAGRTAGSSTSGRHCALTVVDAPDLRGRACRSAAAR